jgi:SAM-dependent methyltransferase
MSDPTCAVCGYDRWTQHEVLWPELIDEWGLDESWQALVTRQQGLVCDNCGTALRSAAIAEGIRRIYGFAPAFKYLRGRRPWLRVLEINSAGNLHVWLSKFVWHTFAEYPNVDMQRLPYADKSFNLVVHSDTLEHVPDPVQGLRECLRVLRPGGWLVYTIPMTLDRLTARRHGLPRSMHGTPDAHEWLVVSEYGGDAWTEVIEAGASEVRIVAYDYPACQVLVAQRGGLDDARPRATLDRYAALARRARRRM